MSRESGENSELQRRKDQVDSDGSLHPKPVPMPHYEVPTGLLNQFADQINQGQYYEAHESMEEIWILNDRPRPSLLQALVQMAASLEHWKRGNINGARALALRALQYVRNLHSPGVLDRDGDQAPSEEFIPFQIGAFVEDFRVFAERDFGGAPPEIQSATDH